MLVPTTPVTRKAIGLSSTQCAANFLGCITSGDYAAQLRCCITSEDFGCHQPWSSVLWEKWNMLSAKSER